MSLDVVILAAGKGVRMKSQLPKVLHPLGGRPMIRYGVEAAAQLSGRPPVVVTGHGSDQVRAALGDAARYVLQAEQLGTGHAVAQARQLLEGAGTHVMITYGDMPLLRSETLQALYQAQQAHSGPLSLVTITPDQPRGFGHILRTADGSVQAIVEEADATPQQRAIREVNAGVYCFEAAWLWSNLAGLPLSPKGEYYLTDLIGMAVSQGAAVNAVSLPDATEALGINDRTHLAEAEVVLRQRINAGWMRAGVTIIDPATTYISPDVLEIGQDTVLHPNTILKGAARIGQGCHIGPNTTIDASTLADGVQVTYSVIEGATLEEGVSAGPFAHLRAGAHLEAGVHMGNFGEVKNSRLRRGVKMGHFSYIGDADIGEETNIGAGTITANYDGHKKNRTTVGKHVFIGSDTLLIAPVVLGDGARTGAGSVVTRDVPPGTLVIGAPARPRPPVAPDQEG